MNFVSVVYALFLGLVIVVYWSVPTRSLRLTVLLLASLAFYGISQPIYAVLMLANVLINFWLAVAIGSPPDLRITHYAGQTPHRNDHRRKLLIVGIGLNLLLLFGFKYVPFVLETAGWGLKIPALLDQASWVAQHVVAPLGISFFSFECIAYLVDVYRGAPAAREFLEFATYKLFFPKLISGPITRYHHLATQLKQREVERSLSADQLAEGAWLIACGAIKKGLVADSLGVWVNLIFGNLERAGSVDLWLAIVAYALQLYLDFSGYVDIARGSAMLLGIDLPPNFDFPYFSRSIADFWRRWHMTLGDWLRNYLYFPLGGSRQGLARTCFNLFLVMVIGGIWHGAAWGFIVWGTLHGLGLALHRLTDAYSERYRWMTTGWQSPLGTVMAWALTQALVLLSWIFFRLPDLAQSGWVIQNLWGRASDAQMMTKIYEETLGVDRAQLGTVLLLIMGVMAIAYGIRHGLQLRLNWTVKVLLVPVCLFAVWLLAPEGVPFIYFDF